MPSHLPTPDFLDTLPVPTTAAPWRILASSCLAGKRCGYDGSSYGDYPVARQLIGYPNVRPVLFCPEHFSFGTPRALCNIHGGTGHDVLDGRARVLTEEGADWTEGMIRAARRMLQVAQDGQVQLAVLMDISAACGSQVIYDGHRTAAQPVYRIGAGVCAALLIRNGIPVVSQRDYFTLGLILQRLDPGFMPDPEAADHHQSAWYHTYFKTLS